MAYDEEKTMSVLGDEWRLENYRRSDTSSALERKPGYETKYEFDFNDDDKADATESLPFPDLLFVNKRTNARLEVSSIVLGERYAHKELRILLQDVIDARTGTRALFVGVGKRAAVGVEKRYATRLVEAADASIGEQKGLAATLERADLDLLQADPKTPWERSRLFLAHAPFKYMASELTSVKTDMGSSVQHKYHPYPVLFLVEYTNTNADFEAQYAEFVRLMEKVHFLTDAMLMEYLGGALARCAGQTSKAKVELSIGENGEPSVSSSGGLDSICTSEVFGPYRFAGTGEPRKAVWEYAFPLPQARPTWLGRLPYQEKREAAKDGAGATPAAAPAAGPTEQPAPEQAPAPTSEAPPAAPTTPEAATSPAPAPPAPGAPTAAPSTH